MVQIVVSDAGLVGRGKKGWKEQRRKLYLTVPQEMERNHFKGFPGMFGEEAQEQCEAMVECLPSSAFSLMGRFKSQVTLENTFYFTSWRGFFPES